MIKAVSNPVPYPDGRILSGGTRNYADNSLTNFMTPYNLAAGWMSLIPWFGGRKQRRIFQLECEVTGAFAGGSLVMAVYAVRNRQTDPDPGALIRATAPFAATTNGRKTIGLSAACLAAVNRWYWLALLNVGAVSIGVRAMQQNFMEGNPLHLIQTTPEINRGCAVNVGGVLPDPCPAVAFGFQQQPLISVQ